MKKEPDWLKSQAPPALKHLPQSISLRDYFAGQTISGIASLRTFPGEDWSLEVIAKAAYAVADAMVQASEKNEVGR